MYIPLIDQQNNVYIGWITDESLSGIPHNERGTVYAILDGRIRNISELKNNLKNMHVQADSPAEILIHAYENFGLQFFRKIDGIFSIVIYDREKGRIILFRDPYGVKPLYYYYDGNVFVFSSEAKAILKHKYVKKAPNDEVIFDYLLFIWPTNPEETFFKGIYTVLPDHIIIYDLNSRKLLKTELHSYAKQALKSNVQRSHLNKTISLLRDRIRQSIVNETADLDQPYVALLSGGLDSSSIVCTLREVYPKADIHAFSIVFPNTEADESHYQMAVVRKTKVKWYKLVPSIEDLVNELRTLVYLQDFPIEGLGCFAQYMLFKEISKKGYKHVLDGMGADGLFAGLSWVLGYYLFELLFKFKLLTFAQEFVAMVRKYGIHEVANQLISVILINLLSNLCPSLLVQLVNEYRGGILKQDFLRRYATRAKNTLWRAKTLEEILDNETIGSLHFYPRYADRNSTFFNIELRYPFLNNDLIKLTRSIPSMLKVRKGYRKFILRVAMKDTLPKEVLCRIDKKGFATPDRELLLNKRVRKLVLGIILSHQFKSRPYWDYRRIYRMFKETILGERDWSPILWKIIFLELWLRTWGF